MTGAGLNNSSDTLPLDWYKECGESDEDSDGLGSMGDRHQTVHRAVGIDRGIDGELEAPPPQQPAPPPGGDAMPAVGHPPHTKLPRVLAWMREQGLEDEHVGAARALCTLWL